MQTTFKQQAAAIKFAMKAREAVLQNMRDDWDNESDNKYPKRMHRENDKQYLALNDAYSTLIAIQLNQKLTGAVS